MQVALVTVAMPPPALVILKISYMCFVGIIDYRENTDKSFDLPLESLTKDLDIMVENMGRVNFVNGTRDRHTFEGQLKGILGKSLQ